MAKIVKPWLETTTILTLHTCQGTDATEGAARHRLTDAMAVAQTKE
jgi:hypothetical protein